MEHILKIRTLGACQSIDSAGLDQSLIGTFLVCFSDLHFSNSSPDNQHFICKKESEKFWKFKNIYSIEIPQIPGSFVS